MNEADIAKNIADLVARVALQWKDRAERAETKVKELEEERRRRAALLAAIDAACRDWFDLGCWSPTLLLHVGTAWRALRWETPKLTEQQARGMARGEGGETRGDR